KRPGPSSAVLPVGKLSRSVDNLAPPWCVSWAESEVIEPSKLANFRHVLARIANRSLMISCRSRVPETLLICKRITYAGSYLNGAHERLDPIDRSDTGHLLLAGVMPFDSVVSVFRTVLGLPKHRHPSAISK